MHINFCCCNTLMPQHKLNRAQVSAVFKQMCSKRVPEGMGAYGLIQVYFFGQPLYYGENHGTCKPLAPAV